MGSENEFDADEWYGGDEETYLPPATAVYNPVHSGHADGAAAEDGIADAEEELEKSGGDFKRFKPNGSTNGSMLYTRTPYTKAMYEHDVAKGWRRPLFTPPKTVAEVWNMDPKNALWELRSRMLKDEKLLRKNRHLLEGKMRGWLSGDVDYDAEAQMFVLEELANYVQSQQDE
mmetsp:Transcript_15727/g.32818  ORF Transcript_15727/g.32818 Transcript_15727/m.32818 type:complete len:173 (-) Transcript_15727:89-607(-)